MAKIHFVDHTGEKRTVEIENGATVMEAAAPSIAQDIHPANTKPVEPAVSGRYAA